MSMQYTPQQQKTITDALTDMYQQIAESLCNKENVIEHDTALLIRLTLGPILFEDFKKNVSTGITVDWSE